jgi:hypothetical protein
VHGGQQVASVGHEGVQQCPLQHLRAQHAQGVNV